MARRLEALRALGLVAALGAVSMPVTAETMYVTDRLLLGLYAERGDQGQRLKLLTSGTPIEIVQRQGAFALVKTPDETEGWVKTAFLVDEKPAALRVAEMEREAERLNSEIEQLLRNSKVELAKDLQERLAQTEASLAEAQERADALESEVSSLRELKARVNTERALSGLWMAAAAALSLLIGALVGYRLYDRRLRQRFSGLRIE